MNQQSLIHHYIPTFYLRRWAGADEQICQFSRPYKEVKPHRKAPEAAGYQRGLYIVPGLPPETRSILEDKFFKQTDQAANDALQFMLANTDGLGDMSPRLRSGWSRFIVSLLHRSPETVEALREKCRTGLAGRMHELEREYQVMRGSTHPTTFEEFRALIERNVQDKAWAVLLERVIDSVTVGTFLNAMRWSIVTFCGAPHSLLTSDRPVCRTNGIDRPDGHVALPVGPTQVFVAANSRDIEATLRQTRAGELHARINNMVVRHAIKYVYGTDDRQLRFVENRLARREPKITL